MNKNWKEFNFEVNLNKLAEILEIIKSGKNILVDFESFNLSPEIKNIPLVFGYSQLEFNKNKSFFFMKEYKSIFIPYKIKNPENFWKYELRKWFKKYKEKNFIFLGSKLELEIFNNFIGIKNNNFNHLDLYDLLNEPVFTWIKPKTELLKTKFVNFIMEDYKTVIDARKINEFFSYYLNDKEWKNRKRYIIEVKEKNEKDLQTMIEILNWLNKLII
ncbi:hypothetical protein [Spiroplasma cantharicola]|uniref:Uncharacterized protein n=1 Tax=Spiroplasma cantharicola TaxID=362837 RepID=A0A0M4JS79_9MOLU|nr:hypothetical protein [Spiroplasma cantharicola]ALD66360.1 hypothetical protein SCANT_v1c04540 [Spiroplasma cantharicola]